jgi:hypothetical protein
MRVVWYPHPRKLKALSPHTLVTRLKTFFTQTEQNKAEQEHLKQTKQRQNRHKTHPHAVLSQMKKKKRELDKIQPRNFEIK